MFSPLRQQHTHSYKWGFSMEHIHQAKVYLAMARAFRARKDSFFFTLLEWAAKRRKQAQEEFLRERHTKALAVTPEAQEVLVWVQQSLF